MPIPLEKKSQKKRTIRFQGEHGITNKEELPTYNGENEESLLLIVNSAK
jgi:hypothetical protein